MPIKWQPFKELEDFNRQNPFGGPGPGRGGWVPFFPDVPMRKSSGPAVDIYQDKNNLYVEMPLPGIKPENVEVSIENNVLSVQGREEDKKVLKDTDYIHREIRRGSFRRVIKLPVEVKDGKAEAEFSNGVLKISIPKSAKTPLKANKVPIRIK